MYEHSIEDVTIAQLLRVSAMQGLLEVRLEVPQITLMLTMPQVYLTSHFASYWTNKFLGGGGEEDLLHGSALRTLAQQALDIGTNIILAKICYIGLR